MRKLLAALVLLLLPSLALADTLHLPVDGVFVVHAGTKKQAFQILHFARTQDVQVDLTVYQDNGSRFDLTGYTLLLSVKKSPTDAAPVINRTGVISNAAQGVARFTITGGDTLGLLPRNYWYDVWVTGPAPDYVHERLLPTSTLILDPVLAEPTDPLTYADPIVPLNYVQLSPASAQVGNINIIGNIAVGGGKLTGLGTPTASTDAATKGYVDSHSGGITDLTGDVTASGSGSVVATLAASGVTPGSYTAANITVDAKGRVTAAASGSALPAQGSHGGELLTTNGTAAAWSGSLLKFIAPGGYYTQDLQVDADIVFAPRGGGFPSIYGGTALHGQLADSFGFYGSNGYAASGAEAAGAGGDFVAQGGIGGAATGPGATAGNGGNISINGGPAGAASGGATAGRDGQVALESGWRIKIGADTAPLIVIGNATTDTQIAGQMHLAANYLITGSGSQQFDFTGSNLAIKVPNGGLTFQLDNGASFGGASVSDINGLHLNSNSLVDFGDGPSIYSGTGTLTLAPSGAMIALALVSDIGAPWNGAIGLDTAASFKFQDDIYAPAAGLTDRMKLYRLNSGGMFNQAGFIDAGWNEATMGAEYGDLVLGAMVNASAVGLVHISGDGAANFITGDTGPLILRDSALLSTLKLQDDGIANLLANDFNFDSQATPGNYLHIGTLPNVSELSSAGSTTIRAGSGGLALNTSASNLTGSITGNVSIVATGNMDFTPTGYFQVTSGNYVYVFSYYTQLRGQFDAYLESVSGTTYVTSGAHVYVNASGASGDVKIARNNSDKITLSNTAGGLIVIADGAGGSELRIGTLHSVDAIALRGRDAAYLGVNGTDELQVSANFIDLGMGTMTGNGGRLRIGSSVNGLKAEAGSGGTGLLADGVNEHGYFGGRAYTHVQWGGTLGSSGSDLLFSDGNYISLGWSTAGTVGTKGKVKIDGRVIAPDNTTPTSGQVLAWNGSAYVPTTVSGTGTVTSIAFSSELGGSTITSSGSVAIAANGVTNSMLATMSGSTLKGQTEGGSGSPVDLTVDQAREVLNGGTPTIAVSSDARMGTSPSASITGSDTDGKISLTVGSSPSTMTQTTTFTAATVTLSRTHANAPSSILVFPCSNTTAANLTKGGTATATYSVLANATTSTWTVNFSTGSSSAPTYAGGTFCYHVGF